MKTTHWTIGENYRGVWILTRHLQGPARWWIFPGKLTLIECGGYNSEKQAEVKMHDTIKAESGSKIKKTKWYSPLGKLNISY